MLEYTADELNEALRALQSVLAKCRKIDAEKLGRPQKTLLQRRIRAVEIALTLIEKQLGFGISDVQ